MRKNEDNKNTGHRFLSSIMFGAGLGFLLVVLLFAVFSALIASGTVSDGLMPYLTVAVAFIGALIGAFVAAKRYRGKLAAVGVSVGGVMFLVTLVGAAFNESGNVIGSMTPFMLAALLGGGLIGAFLCLKRKKRKHA
jgi:putative membrane protein (TIGR04086 family)